MMEDLRQRYLELVQRGLALRDAMGECDVEQLDEFEDDCWYDFMDDCVSFVSDIGLALGW